MVDVGAAPPRPRVFWVVAALCVMAFVVRASAFIVLDRLTHPDVCESDTIAANLLQGKGFVFTFLGTVYRSYMEPLYPGFCAALAALMGRSTLVLALAHVIFGTLLVGVVYVCARQVGSSGAALFATAMAALHPGLVLYTTKFHPFLFDSLLFLSVLASCLLFSARRPWRAVVIIGLLIGLCTLTRPTVLASVPIVWWWVWKRSPSFRSARLAQLCLIPLIALAVVSPWVWRNYQIHHRLLLTRSGSPMVLWLGNNPYQVTGSALTPDGRALLINAAPPEVQRHILSLDELGQQDFFFAQAWQQIREHPALFLQRWAQRFWYFWWFTPQTGAFYPVSWLRLYHAVYVILLALIGLGLVGYWRAPASVPLDRQAVLLIAGFCLSVALLQSVFYIEGRHRLAIEPLLVILAGQGLWWLWVMGQSVMLRLGELSHPSHPREVGG